MNGYAKTFLLIMVAFTLGLSVGLREDTISPNDVESTQKLIGLDFSTQEIDTMLTYLEENLEGYDSMRKFSRNLNYETVPPIFFDPLPLNFQINPRQEPIDWNYPERELPKDKNEIAFLTVPELASLIRSGKITSVELTEIYLERIKKFDPQLKAVITVTEDLALSQARKADQEISSGKYKGPLHGIPYGIKDLFATEKYHTTWGAMPYKDQIVNYDATIVTKLREAGAVLVAKLTSGALARGDVWFGGKTRNPWDLEQGASGSSAGSGSATAAGLVGFSIGTETLGSIISPSTRSGVTGLRPSYGRVSRYGGMPLSWTMDKPGPICRSATGCAMVFDVIRGVDNKDRTVKEASFNYDANADLGSLKIGYLPKLFENDSSDNAVNNEESLETLKSMGIQLIPKKLPEDIPYEVFDIILRAEAGAFFDDLVRSKRDSLMVQQHKGSRANSLRQSRFIPAVEYLQANRHRAILIERMHDLMQDIDILISPTFGFRQLLITNLTGHPAMSLPNGLDDKGRPTSFTIVGNLFDEAALITFAEKFQDRTAFEESHPPNFAKSE